MEIEDQVQLTDISEILVQNFDQKLNQFQTGQFVVSVISLILPMQMVKYSPANLEYTTLKFRNSMKFVKRESREMIF